MEKNSIFVKIKIIIYEKSTFTIRSIVYCCLS